MHMAWFSNKVNQHALHDENISALQFHNKGKLKSENGSWKMVEFFPYKSVEVGVSEIVVKETEEFRLAII